MRMKSWLGAVLIVSACTYDPQEEIRQHDIQLTDGFKFQGGVLVTESHALTHLAMLEAIDDVQIVLAGTAGGQGKVLKRNKQLNVALVFVRGTDLKGAKIGESGTLEEGATLVAQVYDKEGVASTVSGSMTGWRFHEGHAYVQTDLKASDEATGAGVFGPDGKLVGLIAFTRGTGLTYVLPVEYVANGRDAIIGHPDLRRFIDPGNDSDAFAQKRTEAKEYTESLAKPLAFAEITYTQTFSRTALVGELTMLDKKQDGSHTKPVGFRLDAVDAARKRRTLAKGFLAKGHVKWHSPTELNEKIRAEQEASYGADFVAKNVAPYEFGFLRYRIPFGPFCSQVSGEEVHVLTLKLADGRTSGDIGFSDLVNICAAQEDGEGTTLEAEWGLEVGPAAAAAAVAPAKAKGKRGRKKGRRKKRRR